MSGIGKMDERMIVMLIGGAEETRRVGECWNLEGRIFESRHLRNFRNL